MKRRWAYPIQIALLLVMISGLTAGCAGLSSVPTPPASEYPADIIGRVTIAKKIVLGGTERTPSLSGREEFWIVEVSVKNKEYPLSVASMSDPSIPLPKLDPLGYIWLLNDMPPQFIHPLVTVPPEQSGKIILGFEVRAGLNPSNYQICYKGQEPFSYGELITGDTVAVYDWDLKKVTQAKVSQKTIATVQNIWVGSSGWAGSDFICVELKPTSSAQANKVYTVDLYEMGKLRTSTKVSWNQPEINVSKMKPVRFPATKEEWDAYYMEDVSHIFSVKVHE